MSVWSTLRISGAWWFVPLAFAIQSLILMNESTPSGYVQSDMAQAVTFGLYPVGPLLAGVAALESHGFRRFHAVAPQQRRDVIVRAFAPLIVGTPVAVVVAMLLRAQSLPADARTWALVSIAFLILLACGLWGLAIASALPTLVAVPAAVALPFGWIALSPAVDATFVRRLSPNVPCCRIDTQLAPAFLLGLATVVVLMCVGLALAMSTRRWSRRPRVASASIMVGVVVVAYAAALGVLRADGTPLKPGISEPRAASQVCKDLGGSTDRLRVCVWPEQADVIGKIADQVRQLNVRVRHWALPTVSGVNQQSPRGAQISVRSSTVGFPTRAELQLAVAAGFVAREARCSQGLRGDRAAEERVAAVALALGWRAQAGEIPEKSVRAARAALDSDPGAFSRWFTAGVPQIRCGED